MENNEIDLDNFEYLAENSTKHVVQQEKTHPKHHPNEHIGGDIDIAHVQVNLVNVADFAEMNRAYAEHFTQPYPARTVIGIAALPKPGALLTLNAVAVTDER